MHHDPDRRPHYRLAHRFAFPAFGAPLEAITQTLEPPTGHEVTVQVRHCGVCHSDLHFQAGGFDLGHGQVSSLAKAGAVPPITMGHEIGGVVVECGPEVQGLAPGDAVVVYPWLGCGQCPVCAAGGEHLCTRAMRILGLQLPGGYGDLVRVPHARYALPIGRLDPARAATYACAGITAMGAIRQLGELNARHRVAVIGCGGVGLLAVALLAALTPAQVIAIDRAPTQREAAQAQGAAQVHDSTAADAARSISKANPQGIDAVIDFVGSEASAALALGLVRRAGQIVFVGLFGGEFRLPLPLFALRSLRITGSYVGSLQDLRDLIDLGQRVDLPATPLSLRPLAEVNQVLADMAAGRLIGRVVLQP